MKGLNIIIVSMALLGVACGSDDDSEPVNEKLIYEILPANYTPRENQTVEVFNDQFVILGGNNDVGEISTFFSSRVSNDGELWTTIAPFPEMRRQHTSVVFDNKLWVFGGRNAAGEVSTIYNISNVSPDSGEVWNSIENTAGLLHRRNHTQVVLNDKMYIIGGFIFGFGFTSEVWSSPNGEDWQLLNDSASFGVRSNHTSVIFNNKIWVIAGTNDNLFNDVWFSENGTDWILVTEHAGFTPRVDHSSVVYDNKIWVYGGLDIDENTLGDLWYSTDGVNWLEAEFELNNSIGELPLGLANSSLVVKDNTMYVIGGRDGNGSLINYTIKIQ